MPEAWVPVAASMIASANIVLFMEPLDVVGAGSMLIEGWHPSMGGWPMMAVTIYLSPNPILHTHS